MKFTRIINFCLLVTIGIDVLRNLERAKIFSISEVGIVIVILTYISIPIIAFLGFKIFQKNKRSNGSQLLFKIWLIVLLANLMRGFFVQSGYADLQFLFLTSLPFIFSSFAYYFGLDKVYVHNLFALFLKLIIPLCILLIPLSLFVDSEIYSRIMIPLSIFILFIPFVKKRWKIIIVLTSILSVLIGFDYRTNVLRIFISIFILALFGFRNFIGRKTIKLIHVSIFVIPIIITLTSIFLGTDIFQNISKGFSYNRINDKGLQQNYTTDTRSFLYLNVIASLNGFDDWILGKSPAGTYRSNKFYNRGGANKGIRYHSEVNILNLLLKYGLLGVFVYFLLLYYISSKAILYSNNFIMKLLGLFIASFWFLSFIEQYTIYDLNFFFFWIVLGVASSSYFRAMSDKEIKYYLKSL